MILYERESWIAMVVRVKGSVMPRIMPRVLVVTAVSLVITALQRFNTHHLTLTVSPFLITGLPLGIILGFRNTASYDRFWEGRKLWGALVNGSRSFLRELAMFVSAPLVDGAPSAAVESEVATFRRAMTYRLVALAHSLRLHLRRERDEAALRPFLDDDEIASLRGERCPPAALIHRLGAELAHARSRGWTRTRHVATMETTLVGLTDVVGGCERIKNTPTPLSYLIFIHRAVALYCFLLPFGVAETVHSLTPIVVFFVSYALFSLDAIGDELDDPFRGTENALPIASIARNIEIEARTRLGETDLPKPLAPEDGVLR